MKPGWQTTEFWLTVATTLWAMFGAGIPAPWSVIVPTVATGFYSIARGLAKGGVIRGTIGDQLSK